MEQHVFSVTEVNQYIKSIIDGVPQLGDLLIRGELSNYKIYPSGHLFHSEGRRERHSLRYVPGQRGKAAVPSGKRHAGHRRGTHQRIPP